MASGVRHLVMSSSKSLSASDSSETKMALSGGDFRFRTTGGRIRDDCRGGGVSSSLGPVTECIDDMFSCGL